MCFKLPLVDGDSVRPAGGTKIASEGPSANAGSARSR